MNERRNIPIALPVTGEEEWLALKEPIETGWLTQGPKVAQFEKEFARLHQVKHALAVTSCTTGLHLALAALGIGPGDEVIVPAFTWVATANVVLYCGATPVLIDVDRVTFNIDPNQIAHKVSDRTRAIIAVHLFGLCADIDAIKAVVPDGIKIIEDAACAAGAKYKGKFAGTLGDVASFSFHPRKSITTGEGGMVTTNDSELAVRMNQMRNHTVPHYPKSNGITAPNPIFCRIFNLLGFTYRMTDLQGAIGLVQLTKLNSFIDERAKWAQWYRQQLEPIEWLRLPTEPKNSRHGWQSFVTYVNPDKAPLPRNTIMEKLQEDGVATRPGTHAIHMLNLYKQQFGFNDIDFLGAQDCHNYGMAIPLHNRMINDDYEYVVEAIRNIDR